VIYRIAVGKKYQIKNLHNNEQVFDKLEKKELSGRVIFY
jgi:hypothetical protein